jgi:hypothetical protein
MVSMMSHYFLSCDKSQNVLQVHCCFDKQICHISDIRSVTSLAIRNLRKMIIMSYVGLVGTPMQLSDIRSLNRTAFLTYNYSLINFDQK